MTLRRPTGRPSRERAAEISRDTVDATIAALAEQGGDFNMDQIAETAGISKQAIYRRWPSKLDLIIHAVDRHVDELAASIVTDLPPDPLAALREISWRLFDRDSAFTSRVSLFLQVEAMRHPALLDHMARWRHTLQQLVVQRIAALPPALVDPMEATSLADALQALMSSARTRLAWSQGLDKDVAGAFEWCWRLFQRMMRPV